MHVPRPLHTRGALLVAWQEWALHVAIRGSNESEYTLVHRLLGSGVRPIVVRGQVCFPNVCSVFLAPTFRGGGVAQSGGTRRNQHGFICPDTTF